MLPSVVQAYLEEGYRFRMGSPRLYTSGVHRIGARTHPVDRNALPTSELGFTLTDFYLFDLIGQELSPRTGLIVGNAFGVSAVCLGELLRPISLDVIDAEVCGDVSTEGADLTRRVAARLGLDVRLTRGYSPRDLGSACRHKAYELVFIDGLHQNGQVIADFQGVAPRLGERCAVVFHDIGLCRLDAGWEEIRRLAAPMGLRAFDLPFTDYGLTILLRGAPELESMLEATCPRLRDFNEVYEIGHQWWTPPSPVDRTLEREIFFVPADGRIAFFGAGRDLGFYEPFMRLHPDRVAAVLDDDRSLWGEHRFGIEVIDPSRLPTLGVGAAVIATRSYDSHVRGRLGRLASGVGILPAAGGRFEVELHVQRSPAVPHVAEALAAASATRSRGAVEEDKPRRSRAAAAASR